jgi:uncharacterized integral membrane protein (TIGR00697 family)
LAAAVEPPYDPALPIRHDHRSAVSQPAADHSHPSNPGRPYKYYDFVMAGFVTVLLCSNLIGPGKQCVVSLPFELPLIGTFVFPYLGPKLVFPAGNLFFPIGYIFGDILTEVYGYARSRKVIWAGFGALFFASIMSTIIVGLPARLDDDYVRDLQPALEMVFGNTVRIMLASPFAFWAGDFANSYVMAKMKVWTRGRFLWMRTIGSTIVGQGVDSFLFYPMAFAGIWKNETLIQIVLINWAVKVAVEVIFTPVTYFVVNFLKRAEQEDHYDVNTNFTPFSLQDK